MEDQQEERMSGDECENSSDSEQESSVSSNGDNDKTDEVSDKRILELRDMISNDPYNYNQHVELINLLSKQDDYEQLQCAREHMSSIFPLTEDLWLDWLKDEVKYSETTDRQKIMQLFERAVKDYTSVNVWLEYVQYTIGGMSEEGGLNVIRDTFELALTAAGIHVTQGSLLWDAYREFEMAVFAGLQPQPGSIPDVDSVNKSEAQMSRINKLFQRQLTVPLQDMENTYQEYKDWIGDEIDKETNRKYSKALSKLKELMPFENELISSESPHLDAYNSYIEFEIKNGDPVRVISIFERAICENCLQPELWLRYTKYMEEHLHNRSEVIKIYERAIRNCPWSVNVWIGYLRLLELMSQQHQLIVDVFSRALASGFSSASEYLALWTCYIDYLRRRIRWSEDHEKELEALRIAFQQALNDLTRRFPADGDQCCTLTQYWALIEAKFCHNMSKARELWSSILQLGYSSQAQMCMEYVRLERAYGDQKHCRKLFQRILTSVSDWPELVTDAYVNFEREEGDLESYMEAVKKCEIQMKLVNERREKEAEKEAKLAEQKKAERMEKKKQIKGKQPQQQQKQHYQSDKLSHGKWAKDASEQKTISEIKPYKSKRAAAAADTLSTIGEVSANESSSIASSSAAVECIQQSNEPTVYVRGQKRKMSDTDSDGATESSAEPPLQSSSLQSSAAFKVPPPPGFKGPPPPGFKGPPPGYKPKSDPQSADVGISSSFNADTTESPAKRMKVLESDAGTTQSSGGSFKDDCTVFVSNLDYSVTREQLQDIFSKVGEVVEVRIISNFKGRSKGYAYVQFNNELNVSEALKMDRQPVEGRPMFVSPCNRNASEPKLKFSAGLEKNKLFVRGLPLTMTSDELEQLFAEHGKVKEVRLVTYRNGTPKGLAYVEYQNETSAAQAVLKVDGLKIGDNTLSVAISNPPARNAPTSTNREQLQTFVPSLGGGKKDPERGHARTQLMLVPRNVQQQRSQQTTTPGNDRNMQSGLDSKTTSIETAGKETSTGMSNADFRNMLFKR